MIPIFISWIMDSVSWDLVTGIMYCTSAHFIWKYLHERFNKVNGSKIFQLHPEICLAQQGIDTIYVYINRIRTMWNGFDVICSLHSCKCDLFQKHIQHVENLKLFQFIDDLNEYYSQICSNLDMSEPLHSLNKPRQF